MKELKIEHDKKMPQKSKHVYKDMKVGDSFLVTDAVRAYSLRSTSNIYGNRLNMKFSHRIENGAIRVWRIK